MLAFVVSKWKISFVTNYHVKANVENGQWTLISLIGFPLTYFAQNSTVDLFIEGKMTKMQKSYIVLKLSNATNDIYS